MNNFLLTIMIDFLLTIIDLKNDHIIAKSNILNIWAHIRPAQKQARPESKILSKVCVCAALLYYFENYCHIHKASQSMTAVSGFAMILKTSWIGSVRSEKIWDLLWIQAAYPSPMRRTAIGWARGRAWEAARNTRDPQTSTPALTWQWKEFLGCVY